MLEPDRPQLTPVMLMMRVLWDQVASDARS